MRERIDGVLSLIEGGCLVPGAPGLDNIRRAAEALASYGERAGYEVLSGTRSNLSRRAHINALHPYLASVSYRGPRSLVAAAARMFLESRISQAEVAARMAGDAPREVVENAILCAIGEALRGQGIDFALHKERLDRFSALRFIAMDEAPMRWRPELYSSIPPDVGALVGDDNLPGWVHQTGQVSPESIEDPVKRARLETCLRAFEDVDAGRCSAADAVALYALDRFGINQPRTFQEHCAEYRATGDTRVFVRYLVRDQPTSRLPRPLQDWLRDYAAEHKDPKHSVIRRDAKFGEACDAPDGSPATPAMSTRASIARAEQSRG